MIDDNGIGEFTMDAVVVVAHSSTLLRRRGIFKKQGDDDAVVAVAALVVVEVVVVEVVVVADTDADGAPAPVGLVTQRDGFCTSGGDCSAGLALVSQREHCSE